MVPSSVLFFLAFGELFTLYVLSSQLSKAVFLMVFRMTKSVHIATTFLAIFFLPGVILHEMSHYLSATLVRVRTGKVEFMPEIHGNTVKLGSVEVAQSDLLRRSAIGVAPLLVGCLCLYGISYLSSQILVSWESVKTILVGYSMFLIGNTMFSSKKDMEGVWLPIGLLLIATAVLVYFFREQSLTSFYWLVSQQQFFLHMDMLLFIPIVIDVSVIFLITLFLRRY